MSTEAKNCIENFSYTFKLAPNFDCVIIQFHGGVRAENFLLALENIEQAPDYGSSFNRLIDFRDASIEFSASDIAAMTSWAQTKKYTQQNRKVVHIAQNDADFACYVCLWPIPGPSVTKYWLPETRTKLMHG